jgi:hypothetical protein
MLEKKSFVRLLRIGLVVVVVVVVENAVATVAMTRIRH